MLAEDMAGFRHDPLGHVLYSYPWGVKGTDLADRVGPWQWQRETLERIGARLRAGEATNFEDVIREAISSGHGIGKSALVAWLIRWALDTFEDTRVLVTANTDKQLTTKTWPELTKWHQRGITRDWWVCTATALYSADPKHEKNWRADAVPWSENNTEAFAGLHNLGRRIVAIFDEASAVADPVWEVTEGALTDVGTEIIWLVCGNPTQADGRFRECFRKFKGRWHGQQIDARTVPGTNRKLHDEWIADYGIDSDFVKVRVRGMFPSQSVKGLYNEADVDAAFGRTLRPDQYQYAPVIIACDPAWEGDDMLVIGKRQGLWYDILEEIPKNDNDTFIANKIARYEDEFGADAVFIDLGYGTGIVSAGRTMGRNWTLVAFAEAPNDPGCLNKRAEMAKEVRDWLKQGGCIPGDGRMAQQLREDLLSIQTVARADGKLQLESKKDMKARGVPSPNHLDTLMLTHAHPVRKKSNPHQPGSHQPPAEQYKPLGRVRR